MKRVARVGLVVAGTIAIAIAIGFGTAGLAEGKDTSKRDSSTYHENLAYARVVLNKYGYSDFADAEDHFELQDFAPPAGPVGVAEMRDAKSVVFTTADPGWNGDWHPSPRKQFVFMLGGAIEIEVQDGEARRFVTGDIILLEDTTGRGHDTRVVSEGPALFAIVALPE